MLSDSKAAENAAVFSKENPHRQPHLLHGRLKNKWAVSISGGIRLVFTHDHHDPPKLSDGNIDWKKITKIMIVSISDYHV